MFDATLDHNFFEVTEMWRETVSVQNVLRLHRTYKEVSLYILFIRELLQVFWFILKLLQLSSALKMIQILAKIESKL